MEVWLLESYHNCEFFDEILFHVPTTSYWFGIHLYQDYNHLTSLDFTPIFWDAVKKQDTDLLTRLGTL